MSLEMRESVRAALGLHRKSSAVQKHYYEPAYKPKKTVISRKKQPDQVFEIKSFLQAKLDNDLPRCLVTVQWEPLPHENGKCDVTHESIWEIAKDLECEGELFDSLKEMVGRLPMPPQLLENLRRSRYYQLSKKMFDPTPEDVELQVAAKRLVDMWTYYSNDDVK
jgi:hypothetical protein